MLKFVTFNVNGLATTRDTVSKRRKIFTWRKNKNIDIILMQETHCSKKLERIWKNEWRGDCYFNNGTSGSRGVCVMVSPHRSLSLKRRIQDDSGRAIILEFEHQERSFVVGSIYCPNRDETDTMIFVDNALADLDCSAILLGGDFNCVLSEVADRSSLPETSVGHGGPTSHSAPRRREALLSTMRDYGLTDVWREFHPNEKEFTFFRRGQRRSRLDMFLASDAFMAGGNTTCEILAPFLSDHRAVLLKSAITVSPRGSGYWKFNNQLLGNDAFVNDTKLFLRTAIEENRKPNMSSILLFETVLCMARGHVIQFASRLKRKRNDRLTWLEEEIADSLNSDEPRDDLDTLIEERDGIVTLRAKESIFRCKVNWAAYAEKSSSYFFSLEKRRGQQKTINSMFMKHSADGRATSDTTQILDECKYFYSSLYRSQIHQCHDPADFLQAMPTISETAKIEYDQSVTKRELHEALCPLKKNTSPGPCGWSPEFFITFWDQLGTLYTAVVQEIFEKKILPTSFTTSITTLLPKKQKDRRLVENLRPISLLSVTYKILAKALATRIAKIASSVVHPDQTGFIKGRYIGENVRLILDLIKYTEDKCIPGLIVQCDYYKAYDCVEWKYVNRVMETVGFGPNFLRWMQIFYPWSQSSPYQAKISVNNFLSQPYPIERGIRQGCPLSCLVWTLCLEPMACSIRNHPGIGGITVADEEVKLSLYADDTTLILDGSDESLRNSLQSIYSFCKISGLKLNASKTVCYWIGEKRNSTEKCCQ